MASIRAVPLPVLLLLLAGCNAAKPEHYGGGGRPSKPGPSTCSTLPYAVPLNNGTVLSSVGSATPTFKLREEYLSPIKFFPFDIGETVALKALILDPTASTKEIGFAYWTGVALGVVDGKAVINFLVTFAFTQGPGRFRSYGPGLITASGAISGPDIPANLQIVGGGGSFCWVTGGQLTWRKLDVVPGVVTSAEASIHLNDAK